MNISLTIPNARTNHVDNRKAATLKHHLKDKELSVYLNLRIGTEFKRFNTGVKVNPRDWDFAKQEVRAGKNLRVSINRALHTAKMDLQEKVLEFQSLGLSAPEIIGRLSVGDSDFWAVWDLFISQSTKTLSPLTIKKYKTAERLYKEFSPSATFKGVDLSFYDRLVVFFNDKDYVDATAAKYGEVLVRFMRWAYDRNYHNNDQFKRFRFHKATKYDFIALTLEELEKIASTPFTGPLRRIKMLFLFMCFTGQRWDDYANFEPDHVVNGVWTLEQKKNQKRKNIVSVPLTGFCGPARDILEKLEHPRISNQKFNVYIKDVCRIAGIDSTVTITRRKGNRMEEKTAPRYEFVSAHTSRRTFVTLAIAEGIPLPHIQAITGQTLKTLEKYVHNNKSAIIKSLNRVDLKLKIS